MRPLYRLIVCVLAVALAPLAAFAEDTLPLRAGWISLAEAGSAFRDGAGAWSSALVNEPVTQGSSLRTGPGGRAEIRLAGVAIVLAPATEVTIVRLDDDTVRVVLEKGRIGLRLDRPQTVEIDSADGKIRPSAPGRYDIAAGAADRPAQVAVLAGSARATGGAAVAADDPASADGFTEWWRSRDGDNAAASLPSPELAAIPGVTALAGDGDWKSSDYGPIWYPKAIPDGWVPFRYGTWHWLPPWGWTWIDDAPWGFAPSHYGRWVQIDHRWGWVPGTREAPPAYVPAVVAFLGTPGIGLSYAGGSGPAEAWFPLGPGEVYWPPHRQDIAAIRRMNASSGADVSLITTGPDGGAPAAIVNGSYRNRRFASAVPRAVFVGAKPVAASLVQIPGRRLDVAPLIPGGPQIAPAAPRPPPPAVATAQIIVRPHHGKTKTILAAALPHRAAKTTQTAARPHHVTKTAHVSPARHVAALHSARPRRPAAATHPHARVALSVHPHDHLGAAAQRQRHGRHGRMRVATHRSSTSPKVVRLSTAPARRPHLAAARHIALQ